MSQLDIFGNEVKTSPKPIDKTKRNWENAFQKWSNKQFHEGRYGYGACGYGSCVIGAKIVPTADLVLEL